MVFNLGPSDLCARARGSTTRRHPTRSSTRLIARRVEQHYNDGWAHGYQLGIRYWEIWNEPDLIPFWTGTPAQFYALYAATAARSRACTRGCRWAARR